MIQENSGIKPRLIEEEINYDKLYGPIYRVIIQTKGGTIDLNEAARESEIRGFVHLKRERGGMGYIQKANLISFDPDEEGREGFFLDFLHEIGHPITINRHDLGSGEERETAVVLVEDGLSCPHVRIKHDLDLADLQALGPWFFEAINYLIFTERSAWAFALWRYREWKSQGKDIAPEFQTKRELSSYVEDAISRTIPSEIRFLLKLKEVRKLGRVHPNNWRVQ